MHLYIIVCHYLFRQTLWRVSGSSEEFSHFFFQLTFSWICFTTTEMKASTWDWCKHRKNHGMKWLTSRSWTLPGKELWDCVMSDTVGWYNFELYTVSLILTFQCWITDSPFIWKKSNFQGLESILTVTLQWKNSTYISSAVVHSIHAGS